MLSESHFMYAQGFKSNKRTSQGGEKFTAACSWALNQKSLFLCVSAPGAATSTPSHHCGDDHLVLSPQITSVSQAWGMISSPTHFATSNCFQHPWLWMKQLKKKKKSSPSGSTGFQTTALTTGCITRNEMANASRPREWATAICSFC